MRSVFVGDVVIGRPILAALRDHGDVALIATSGERHRSAAQNLGSRVLEVSALNEADVVAELGGCGIDLIVNFNSTALFSSRLLDCPRIGSINFHPGLLPDYGGLNVHQWAILNGELTTGVTIHVMPPAIDAGEILACSNVEIGGDETGLTLLMKLLRDGARLMPEVLDRVSKDGFESAVPQAGGFRHFYRRSDRPDGRIEFARSGMDVRRFVRALSYRPMASPIGTPRVVGPNGELEVISLTVRSDGADATASPGEVLALERDRLEIGIVSIDRVYGFGDSSDLREAARRIGIEIGAMV